MVATDEYQHAAELLEQSATALDMFAFHASARTPVLDESRLKATALARQLVIEIESVPDRSVHRLCHAAATTLLELVANVRSGRVTSAPTMSAAWELSRELVAFAERLQGDPGDGRSV